MKYGIIACDSRDGSEEWCRKNGVPLSFDYAYEADYFANNLTKIINSPAISYCTKVLDAGEFYMEE